MSAENGACHRRFGPFQGVWWMECIEVRQTCKKNGLKRSQERLETDFCTFLVGFQRKVGRVVGRERNGGKLQPQTAAEHTLSTLGMNLLDIIFAPTRARA